MNGKEIDLAEIESKIATLNRELSVLQKTSVTGHGEIVNHGHRLEVDKSLRLSNLLNRISTLEKATKKEFWERDSETKYIYPGTYTDYVSIGYSSKGSEILSVDGNIETLDGHYVVTDKVRARDGDGLLLQDDGGNGITIAEGGVCTFDSFPITPSAAPTTNYQVSNKKYVDDSISGTGNYSFKTITGITNDVVADSATDTLTLASGNNILGIVGTAASDTVTFTIDETKIDHGNIAGLADDDHTQYMLDAGTSVDNTIPRFDGTDGRTMQTSGIVVDDSDNVSSMGTLGCGAITSTGNLDIGAHTFTVNSIEIVGADGEVNKSAVEDSGNWDTAYGWGDHAGLYDPAGTMTTHESTYNHANYDTAYSHSQDNTQAHSDYLLNNANDTTSGTLGMASGSTIGTLTLADGSITDSGGALDFGNEHLTTTGHVGIGVAPDVNYVPLLINRTITARFSSVRGIEAAIHWNPSANSGGDLLPINMGVYPEGSSDMRDVYAGAWNFIATNNSNACRNYQGFYVNMQRTNTTMTFSGYAAMFNIYSSAVAGAAIVVTGNGYGVWLRDYTTVFNIGGTAYGIKQEGSTLLNQFAGKLAIGAVPLANECDVGCLKDGVLAMKETTTPTADANYAKLYSKNDNKLYFQDGAGTEHEVDFV